MFVRDFLHACLYISLAEQTMISCCGVLGSMLQTYYLNLCRSTYAHVSVCVCKYTYLNQVGGTNNLLAAVVDSDLDIHVVHLGTMGVYGYGSSGGV